MRQQKRKKTAKCVKNPCPYLVQMREPSRVRIGVILLKSLAWQCLQTPDEGTPVISTVEFSPSWDIRPADMFGITPASDEAYIMGIGGHSVRYPWSAISDWAWYRNVRYRTEVRRVWHHIGYRNKLLSDIRYPTPLLKNPQFSWVI
jgi:hypothetical protein